MITANRPYDFDEPKHLVGQVADQLRKQIISGELPFGVQLSDKELAERMKISRTPVREALLQLKSEGLVVMKPQRGTYVFDVTLEEIEDICQVRSILETGALHLLTTKNLPILKTLRQNLDQAAVAFQAKDYVRLSELDTEFHESIVALCGNKLLIETYRSISDKVQTLRNRLPRSPERFSRAITQHGKIVELVSKKKVNAATAELNEHILNVHRILAHNGFQ